MGVSQIQAVEEVALSIKEGECLALVGESGSGKTTLGKACLGLLPQNAETAGRILLNDREIDFSNSGRPIPTKRCCWKVPTGTDGKGGTYLPAMEF